MEREKSLTQDQMTISMSEYIVHTSAFPPTLTESVFCGTILYFSLVLPVQMMEHYYIRYVLSIADFSMEMRSPEKLSADQKFVILYLQHSNQIVLHVIVPIG